MLLQQAAEAGVLQSHGWGLWDLCALVCLPYGPCEVLVSCQCPAVHPHCHVVVCTVFEVGVFASPRLCVLGGVLLCCVGYPLALVDEQVVGTGDKESCL